MRRFEIIEGMDLRRRWSVVALALGGALIGIAYVLFIDSDGQAGTKGMAVGAMTGLLIAGTVSAFELFAVSHPYSAFRRLPVTISVLLRVIVQVILVIACIVIVQAGGDWLTGTNSQDWSWDYLVTEMPDITFSLAVCLLIVVFLQVRLFIGTGQLLPLLLGVYTRPVERERIFLIIDVRNSTRLAREMGDTRFHRYLNQLFILFDRPILRHRGSVHSYVGDAIIAVWPLRRNARVNARPIRALRDILRICETEAARVERRYGARPSIRAAIHGGRVVVGETGDSRRQITYLGDVLNITARIEAAARDLGEPYLISQELASRIDMPAGIGVDGIGAPVLKGAGEAVPLAALRFGGLIRPIEDEDGRLQHHPLFPDAAAEEEAERALV